MNEPVMQPRLIQEQIQYRHNNTPLNMVFFGQANVDNLQQKIHDAVLEMSNGEYNLSPQSEADLLIITRGSVSTGPSSP
jgi:hypothetical protein